MTDSNHLKSVYLSARRLLARSVSRLVPPHEVEDIVQETYVRVCQVKQPEAINCPRSFLLRTAKNLALDYIKRADNRLVIHVQQELEDTLLEVSTGEDDTFRRAASDQEFALFCEAVRQLPVQCRRVFVLKKVYGYSQKEIAKQLDISESTVEKHIATGMLRCAGFLTRRNETAMPVSASGRANEAFSDE
jgi:RNA polymerase sigma factor (sigma-70 family)